MGVLKCFPRNRESKIPTYTEGIGSKYEKYSYLQNYICHTINPRSLTNTIIIINDIYNPSKTKRTNKFKTNVPTNKKQSTFI